MNTIRRFLITTIVEKREWLRRTLWGISKQDGLHGSYVTILVDTKPWDEDVDLMKFLETDGIKIEIVKSQLPSRIKRQHQLINHAMNGLDQDEPVCVMDDDYWCPTKTSLTKMFATWTPGRIIVPDRYGCTNNKVKPTSSFSEDGETLIYQDASNHVIRQFDQCQFGMHPLCGNPKVVSPKTWNEVGGFPSAYKHYWFADTELFLRCKDAIVMVDVFFIHADHERNFPEMFSRHNASIFLDRIGRTLDENDPYRKMAEDLIQ